MTEWLYCSVSIIQTPLAFSVWLSSERRRHLVCTLIPSHHYREEYPYVPQGTHTPSTFSSSQMRLQIQPIMDKCIYETQSFHPWPKKPGSSLNTKELLGTIFCFQKWMSCLKNWTWLAGLIARQLLAPYMSWEVLERDVAKLERANWYTVNG